MGVCDNFDVRCLVAVAVVASVGSARAETRLASVRGTVEVQAAGSETWMPATIDGDLPAGARIAVRDGASAELAFGDDGRLHLRERAIVVVALPTRVAPARAAIERGVVELHVSDGVPAIALHTPVARVEQVGGASLIAVDDDGTTRVTNRGGASLQLRSLDARRRPVRRGVAIPDGEASRVVARRSPEPSRPLIAAPTWTAPSTRVVSIGGHGAVVRAGWQPVANASRYRVDVTTPGGTIVAAIDLSPAEDTVLIHRLRPGNYFATVATIDPEGFETRPSEALAIEIVDLPAVGVGADELLVPVERPRDPTAPDEPLRLSVGTQLIVPPPLTCRTTDDEPASPIVIGAGGPITIRCDVHGVDLAPVEIAGEPLDVVLAESSPRLIPRDGSSEITFQFANHAAARAVDVKARGLRVASLSNGDGMLRVGVEPTSGSGRIAEVALVLRDQPTAVVTRIALAIAEPARPPTDRRSRGGVLPRVSPGFDVGGFVGYTTFPADADGASELGNSTDPRFAVTSGPIVGARLAAWPSRRVGLESEVGVVPAGYADADGTATILAYRVHLVGALIRDGRFGLRVVGGAGALSLLDEHGTSARDTDTEMHYGATFSIATSRRLELRLDARHLIGPARDAGFASTFEMSLGAVARFGH
jgi:hypothetical protein